MKKKKSICENYDVIYFKIFSAVSDKKFHSHNNTVSAGVYDLQHLFLLIIIIYTILFSRFTPQ